MQCKGYSAVAWVLEAYCRVQQLLLAPCSLLLAMISARHDVGWCLLAVEPCCMMPLRTGLS